MKAILRPLLTFILGTSISAPVLAQDALPDTQAQALGYKFASGVSVTAIKGDEVALKAKYFVHPSIGLEVHAGKLRVSQLNADLYQAYFSVIWQPLLPNIELPRPYLGIGPAACFIPSYTTNATNTTAETAYFGVIPYGLEYAFPSIPLAVSLDCQLPFIELNRDYIFRSTAYSIGLGAKFLLK